MHADILKNLEPQALWNIFEEICHIPHTSGHEAVLREFLCKKAVDAGLKTEVDQTGNLLISKTPAPGFEKHKTLIMQGHMDMVPQKNSHVKFDFLKESIRLKTDGKHVTAHETTLGADNGIGVAAAMAILLDDQLKCGPLKAVFTVSEETGLFGAQGLSKNFLKGDILLNLDSEDEGIVFIGCAGGLRSNYVFKAEYDELPSGFKTFELTVKGLKGGHSGCDINSGRANALKIISELLFKASSSFDLRLSDIRGGGPDNAIPRETEVLISVSPANTDKLASLVADFESAKRNAFKNTDPDISIFLKETASPSKVFKNSFRALLLKALHECRNGVIAMSDSFAGVVKTSSNLASIEHKDGKILVRSSQRSLNESEKLEIASDIAAVFKAAGAEYHSDSQYPGWEPVKDSKALAKFRDIYSKLFSKAPEELVIHAGLECGIIHSINPDLDMISFGPDIRNPHSPDEYTDVESVQRFWKLLRELLKSF